MIYIHLLMAMLASWRITELFTQDRITEHLRSKFPTYLWQCPRCMSVWVGAWSTLMFALGPVTHDVTRWSLWPFALAWLYLAHVESVHTRRIHKEGRRLVVEARGAGWSMNRNDFNLQETREILARILSQLVPTPSAPPQPPSVAQPVDGAAKVN